MMFEFHEPRTWKWAVPWAVMVILAPITYRMYESPNAELQFWAMLPCGFIGLLFFVGAANLWRWYTRHAEDLFTEHQHALSTTPLVLLAQNLKTMHPEAVKVLNRFGVRTSWQVRVNVNTGQRDWVLADTNVHFGFIEFVLQRSNTALYPKNRFSDGSKKWDPDGLVEDREQYDEFETWLFARLMVTRSHGDYKPAEFIPPWTPALILETMGLTGEQDLYKPAEEARKDLNGKADPSPNASHSERGARPPAAEAASPRIEDRHSGGGNRREIELTDEEMEAIRRENEEYEARYT